MRSYPKPVYRPGDVLEHFEGSGDPAEVSRAAHESAALIVGGGEGPDAEQIRSRMQQHLGSEGIDELAELWSASAASTLPGALWRLVVVRRQLPEGHDLGPEIDALLHGGGHADLGDLLEAASTVAGGLNGPAAAAADELAACARLWRLEQLT